MRIHGTLIADQLVTPDGPAGVTFTDGTHSFPDSSQLTFNPTDFYLSPSSVTAPIVNLDYGWKGVRLRLGSDLALVDAAAAVALTWGSAEYNYGGWWTSGTDITVPAGVYLVRLWGTVLYAYTGTAAAGTFTYTSVLVNGTVLTPPGELRGRPYNGVSGEGTAPLTFGLIPVNPGDIITVTVGSNWVSATGGRVEADRTAICVESVLL